MNLSDFHGPDEPGFIPPLRYEAIDHPEDDLIVTDLKNYAYCPRITFYEHCWPDVRPRTFKMEVGQDAHERERERARRRTLRAYGLPEGERRFGVRLRSAALGLRGELDELVIAPGPVYMPVDYKLSSKTNPSFRLQVTAYAMLIEETFTVRVQTAYLYLLMTRKMEAVPIEDNARDSVRQSVAMIRAMIRAERMPPPCPVRARCRDCEFRRFCNDVR